MDFKKTFDALLALRERFPDMRYDANAVQWGESTVTIVLPVSQETAELFIQAQQMFAPREQTHWNDNQSDPWSFANRDSDRDNDEPPF